MFRNKAVKSEADKAQTALNLKSAFWGVTVNKGIVKQIHGGNAQGPLAGARATVDAAGSMTQRTTVTRLALFGIFALAAPKKTDNRELYLTIEGDGYALCVPVPASKQAIVRQWAASFNLLARTLDAAPAAPDDDDAALPAPAAPVKDDGPASFRRYL
jgi:hypothetical protein